MKMNSERAGERVFANVDQALAERIISRSRENCRGAEPVFGGVDGPGVDVVGGGDGVPRRRRGSSVPIIKIAAVALTLLALAALLFWRRGKSNA